MRPVGEGFERPVYATAAPGDPGRLYVVEQHSGRIEILDLATGEVAARPFLDLPDGMLADGNEQGLLGLAFHPDYAENRRFFVFLTRADGDVEVRAYRRAAGDPDRAVAASGDTILRIDKDNGAGNHNGGWIGFGPDGLLHVAVGDEGLAGDPANNAQDKGELWGKILRIDVDGDDFAGGARDYAIPDDNPFVGRAGRDEVWALGLRNPWRASFDRETGDFWLGDVGQDAREEIDVVRAGRPGGTNFGWKVKEGERVFDDGVAGNPPPDSPALTDPLVTYRHGPGGGFAVVGGYVHRGEDEGMQGRYLYADFVSGELWSLRLVGDRAVDVTDHRAQLVGAELRRRHLLRRGRARQPLRRRHRRHGLAAALPRGVGRRRRPDRRRFRRRPAVRRRRGRRAHRAGAGATVSTAAARTTGWRAGAAPTSSCSGRARGTTGSSTSATTSTRSGSAAASGSRHRRRRWRWRRRRAATSCSTSAASG